MSNLLLHPGQSKVFVDMFVNQSYRNIVMSTSRGWGKSHFAACASITAVNELLQLDKSVPNKDVYIVAPTFDQVTDIYHPLIAYQLGMEAYCIKHSKDAGRFWFPNNVGLRLVSFEAVERMRGKGAYFVVNDEPSSWTKGIGLKGAWEDVIEPCLITRWSPKQAKLYKAKSPGRSVTIGTPKGYNYFYDMYNYQDSNPDWHSYHFDYTTSPLLDPLEIEKKRHSMDPISFAREYMATFQDSGNSIFYCFDRKVHVRELPWFELHTDGEFKGQIKEDIHIGIDFNVAIQASSVAAIRGKQINYLDELTGSADTDQLCRAIKGRYWPEYERTKKKPCRIYVYPDPTGKRRQTSAVGTTDFSILEAHGFQVLAHNSSPQIINSVNCVNRMLKTAAGEINMWISPKCKGVITSLERTEWLENNPDTATINKKPGVEHFSDGVRYLVEYCFPIHVGNKMAKRGFGF